MFSGRRIDTVSQDMEIPVGMLNKWWLQRDDISTQFERYCAAQVSCDWLVELQTKVCEDSTITEKAPTILGPMVESTY